MRLIIITLVVLFLLLQYEFWFTKGSVLTAWKLSDRIAVQQDKNKVLDERNHALQADIVDLKQGNQAIEERARSELGMVKKSESFYQIVDTKQNKQP